MIKLEDFINEDNEFVLNEHRGRPRKEIEAEAAAAAAAAEKSAEAPELDSVEGKDPKVDPNSKNKVKWAVDEPERDEANDDLDLNSPDNTDSLDDLIDKFDTEEDFFIIGRAGWGKTSIIKKLASKYDRKVLTVYLDKAEAVDLGGIPVPVKSHTKGKVKNALGQTEEREFAEQMKALPEWASLMLKNTDQDFLLFFDEMNQAAPDVMNALMPIVLEHEICGIKFDNFFVGAAGNFDDENDAVSELSGPLKSRFKPLITWEVNTERAWKQTFKYLHKKWDKVLGKDLVDKFEQNADCFENPRELEMKVFQYIYRIKVKGGQRNNPGKYLRRLNNLTRKDPKDDTKSILTMSQQKSVEKLADEMFNFVAGTGTSKSSRRGKDSQQVPKNIRDYVENAMKKGFISTNQIINGEEKPVNFGICKETIGEFIDEDECNPEMLERLIAKFEADGIKWKYDKPQDWKKLNLEDPMEDRWHLEINRNTKILQEVPKVTYRRRKIRKDY